MVFFVLFLFQRSPFFLIIVIAAAIAALIFFFSKEGYIAGDNGVTFWRFIFLRRHFDYSSIRSADIKVINGGNYRGTMSFKFVLTLCTDSGKYRFYEETHGAYSYSLRKDDESKQALLENSDLMRLKNYIEERIQK
ncbi:MAG: hypothetical protein IJ779_11480 [Ruminococcus sp.]|nr:hypothetical protein [Ruminococcus sp.]